jgi:hypothetical protein
VSDILLRTDEGRALVFHLVSDDGHRIIVVAERGVRRAVGESATVRGEFRAEHTYAGKTYYDALVAENVRRRNRWRDSLLVF